MPAIIAHELSGRHTLARLAGHPAAKAIRRHPNLFSLGTQGPDIFFFSLSPAVARVGDRLHRGGGEFLARALEFAMFRKPAEKSQLFAYLCGYLCHYCLDCRTHPYIFYHSGFSDENAALGGEYTVLHHRFEAALDTMMARRIGRTPHALNIPARMRTSRAERRLLCGLYAYVASWKDAEKHTGLPGNLPLFYTLLREKSGLKRKALAALEKLLGKPEFLSSLSSRESIPPKEAALVMNPAGRIWYSPFGEEIPRYESFFELFEEACLEAGEFCRALYSVFFAGADKEQALGLFGDRCFDSGTESPAKFVRHRSIYRLKNPGK